jgi:hypothetical protein
MKKLHFLVLVTAVGCFLNSGCRNPEREQYDALMAEGKQLTLTYCTTCHKEVPAGLLDKRTWVLNVLPQMGPRLGIHKYKTMNYKPIDPMLVPKIAAVTQEQWDTIVDYFYVSSPDSLPKQKFENVPDTVCPTFSTRPFTEDISSSSVITMLRADTVNGYIYAADLNKNILNKLSFEGALIDSLILTSPPTAMHLSDEIMELTLPGILHPNNESKGSVSQFYLDGTFSNADEKQLIDSLIRPVASICYDFNYDGLDDYLICEYGNDLGHLAIYYADENAPYRQYILENLPGSIMIKIHDFNHDGFMDIAALFAQGDEKIMIFYNDGEGNFRGNFSLAARFPAVYGSMYFDLADFNGDGFMDIIYVNGDNFDYSQILKPYHGVRIFENDGNNSFEEKYFYPIYGAGRAAVVDFDLDGDLDIVAVSNFADMENNPERGIIYLENTGDYTFNPFSFKDAATNQWNTMAVFDADADGDKDVLIGAMNLSNVLKMQQNNITGDADLDMISLLLLENKTR